MTRISQDEKRKEAADWFTGLIGLALVLISLLLGYMAYKNTVIHKKIQQVQQIQQPQQASTTNIKWCSVHLNTNNNAR